MDLSFVLLFVLILGRTVRDTCKTNTLKKLPAYVTPYGKGSLLDGIEQFINKILRD